MALSLANAWIDEQVLKAQGSETEPFLSKIKDLFQRKLWHQLSIVLDEFIRLPLFEEGSYLVQLYGNFLRHFEDRINPLKLVLMLIRIVKQFPDPAEKINFLRAALEKQPQKTEAAILLQTTIGHTELEANNIQETKVILEQTGEALNRLTGVDPTVYASFYLLNSAYNKVKGFIDTYYRNTFLYLQYVPLDAIPLNQQRSIAFDLSVCALISEEVYSFGEILGHPIIKSLEGTDQSWISELLLSFNSGDIATYDRLVQQYQAQLAANSLLVQNAKLMNQKVAIMSLMELIFNRKADDRVIHFSDVSSTTNTPLINVELLLMRALSLKLIKGVIDQVDQTINVSWVQPRTLNLEQVGQMKSRLSGWREKVKNLQDFMSTETTDLIN
mmetsp:Transcript_5481/g.8988  ORF Transcript_5481/g.8988 Transcript_5481/m.8988 type:complete len:386 (-) Transcript_5481:1-1158(-)